jgi:hypothetical protein
MRALRWCAHSLFDPDFCNVASGWEKGIVEKHVQDRRRRLWLDAQDCQCHCFEDLTTCRVQRCRALWSELPHPQYSGQRVAEVLELEAKVDFKIKAKQLVKAYGQMASSMPDAIVAWEKLFWFITLLIPKLKVKVKDKDEIDARLNAADLASYGLERVKLNHSIALDDAQTELDPSNPTPRGGMAASRKKTRWVKSSSASTSAGFKAGA